jgi:elongation factor G
MKNPKDDLSKQYKTRNIGIAAHVDAGKTTTTEHILVVSGIKKTAGEVHGGGTTVTDFREDERQRGITIVSASVNLQWKEYNINVIDTPGHIDFNIEVEKSLAVLDGVVLVIDGKEGIQTQTRTVTNQALEKGNSMICFINKLDGLGASAYHSLDTLRALKIRSVLAQIPVGIENSFRGVIDIIEMKYYYWPARTNETKTTYAPPQVLEVPAEHMPQAQQYRNILLETLSEYDTDIALALIEDSEITTAQIQAALRKAVVARQIMPVFCGAAFKNIGIEPLLDAITLYLPDPIETNKLLKIKPDTVIGNDPKQLVSFAFNHMSDKFHGELYFIRVYNGKMVAGQTKLYNTSTGKTVAIRRLHRIFAAKIDDITEAYAGDIVAISGLKGVKIGDTLVFAENEELHDIEMVKIKVPIPVVTCVLVAKTKDDLDKAALAAQHIAERDLSLSIETDPISGEVILAGMGELHLEVIINQIKSQYGANVSAKPVATKYVETIAEPCNEFVYEHKKQTGGKGQYAKVVFNLKPGAPGSGIHVIDQIKGGVISANYIKTMKETFLAWCRNGGVVKPKSAIVDVELTFVDGAMHPVDSDEMSFKQAISYGIKEAFLKAHPVVLEPIMAIEIEVNSDEYVGAVSSFVSKKAGTVTNVTQSPVTKTTYIHAEIPNRTSNNMINDLRSLTRGNATLNNPTLAYYAPAPALVYKEDVAA